MWHSDQTPGRVKTNQNVWVYLRTTLLLNNTIIRPRRVKHRDLGEREAMYKNRAMDAKKTVYLLMILPRYSRKLAVLVPVPNQPYSRWQFCHFLLLNLLEAFFVFCFLFFFVLFRVRRFILSGPSQNSPTKLLKPCLWSSWVRLKLTEPSILSWITVYPPTAVVWSQYTLKAPKPSGRSGKHRRPFDRICTAQHCWR